MKKTILFGGSGFLGHTFLKEYEEIISVGRTSPSLVDKEIKNIHINLENFDDLSILDNIDFENVIFLVGNSNHHEINSKCMMGLDYNVIPLKKILYYLQKRKINKFVCFTSILLYGDEIKGRPINEQDTIYPYQNEYIFSKYLAEQVVEFYKLKIPIINIRLSNIYGETSLIRPDFAPTLIRDVLTKENPEIWNSKPKRDFIYAKDAICAVVKLLETDYTGTINLGSGSMSSIEDVIKVIENVSGKKITPLNIPVSGTMEFVTDTTLLKTITNWEPKYSMKNGFETMFYAMKKIINETHKEKTISIYGSHDASVTFIDKNKKIRIYEYERFTKKRFAMFSSSFDSRSDYGSNQNERTDFIKLIISNLIDEDIRLILYSELNQDDLDFLKSFFPNAKFEKIGHHYAHACSAYYSSKFKDALIFSIDGGGVDNSIVASTKIYYGKLNEIKEIECPNLDFGNPYSGCGFPISEIRPGADGIYSKHSLSYAGKIMGLCAYGTVDENWKEPFRKYYDTNDLETLLSELNLPYGYNSISGTNSYNLAATSQYIFEEKLNNLLLPYIDKYNTNVVMVGGCALNVLYNQKLYSLLNKKNLNIYIPPNPNDCGQSYGMFLSKFPELGKEEIVYNGLEILDNDNLSFYLKKYQHEDYSNSKIIKLLKQGKIIGIIDDYSEVGPRALGNRSIICDPSFPQMKDILNAKVKFREWYRPFAPVCRLEDRNKYFLDSCESNYMSYAPKFKPEFKDKLSSIVHQDDTTRLQTTTQNQHKIFYEILSELSNEGFIPVILNTSFNIKGLPILSTLEDAFYVLDTTELDYVVTNNKIFSKSK